MYGLDGAGLRHPYIPSTTVLGDNNRGTLSTSLAPSFPASVWGLGTRLHTHSGKLGTRPREVDKSSLTEHNSMHSATTLVMVEMQGHSIIDSEQCGFCSGHQQHMKGAVPAITQMCL